MSKHDWITTTPRVTTDTPVWLIAYKTGALWPATWNVEHQNFEVHAHSGTRMCFDIYDVACYTLRQPSEETPPEFVPVASLFGDVIGVYLFTDYRHRRMSETNKDSTHLFIHSSNVALKDESN
jgi:hypothetical protein